MSRFVFSSLLLTVFLYPCVLFAQYGYGYNNNNNGYNNNNYNNNGYNNNNRYNNNNNGYNNNNYNNNNGYNNNGYNGGGGGGGGETIQTEDLEFSPIPGGILVNAGGVLQRVTALDRGVLARQKLAAAQASYSHLSKDTAKKSPLRFVSLNRLEQAVNHVKDTQGTEKGYSITEEMKYLAGLQRIQYVFYFPESKDIVIGGEAEGWLPSYEGAMVGVSTGQPVCELQDLVTALRAYAPHKDGVDRVSCSIDPTPEGNVRLRAFQQDFGAVRNTRQQVKDFADGIRQALGNQVVTIQGISPKTHAAQILASADYRMKRIGLGIDQPPVHLETFISRTTPAVGSALFRWYFVPDYESIVMTADKTGMELASQRLKLLAETELGGGIKQKSDAASDAYVRSFTQNYPQIAGRVLVFAQLRNFVDALIAAAYIQQQDFYGQAGWNMELFGDEAKFAVERFHAPKEVEPVVGYKIRGGTLMTPVGGGVDIDADEVLEKVQADDGKIAEIKKGVALPAGVWWWDAQ